jgi:hypothetical protein
VAGTCASVHLFVSDSEDAACIDKLNKQKECSEQGVLTVLMIHLLKKLIPDCVYHVDQQYPKKQSCYCKAEVSYGNTSIGKCLPAVIVPITNFGTTSITEVYCLQQLKNKL